MKDLGLKAIIRMKNYRSYKGEIGEIAPNIINRDFYCDKPYTKMATDVSEVKINGVKGYISMVNKTFSHLNIAEGAILHPDQGFHYQNHRYRSLLEKYGITQSIQEKGIAWIMQ